MRAKASAHQCPSAHAAVEIDRPTGSRFLDGFPVRQLSRCSEFLFDDFCIIHWGWLWAC